MWLMNNSRQPVPCLLQYTIYMLMLWESAFIHLIVVGWFNVLLLVLALSWELTCTAIQPRHHNLRMWRYFQSLWRPQQFPISSTYLQKLLCKLKRNRSSRLWSLIPFYILLWTNVCIHKECLLFLFFGHYCFNRKLTLSSINFGAQVHYRLRFSATTGTVMPLVKDYK